MRKLYLTAAFAALALFSCTKEMEVPTPQKEQQPEAEKVWTVTVEAARGTDDLTKSVLTDDGWMEEEADAATKGLELEGNYLKSTWDFKEKVYVYKGDALVGELESQRSGENTTLLAGSLSGSFTVGESLNLFLVGPENARSYIGQKGTLEDIAENYDYARAQVQVEAIDSETDAISLSSASFKNLQSINEFSFGSLKVKRLAISGAGIVGRSATEAYVTVTPEEPANKLYVAISNNKAGEKIPYEFTAEMENGQVHSLRKKAALQDGKYYRAGINYNINTLYDAAKTPLTFEMLEDGLIIIKNPKNLEIQWSVNGSDFVSSSDSKIQVGNLKLGDKVVFSGKNLIYGDGSDSPFPDNCTNIYVTKKAYLYGNINSLRDPFFYYNTSANPALLKAGKTAYAYLFYRGGTGNQICNHPYKDILLPATEVGESAYYGMFTNCVNLTRAPELPATTLASSCYRWMFNGCLNLKQAPELPALQLAERCYYSMFYNCHSLETAPKLPVENLKTEWGYCYAEMFCKCTALKQITCLAKNPSSKFTASWVESVPSSGLFIQHPDAVWISGVSGIPAGWGGQEPLTIEAIEDGTITINNPQRLTLRYSTAANMALGDATSSSKEQIEIPLNAGDKLRLWGDNAAYGHEDGPVRCTNIIGSGLHYVYGDLCSLISSGAYTSVTSLDPYAFAGLFQGNDKLKSHPTEKLVIRPAKVGDGCFRNMFQGCTALERAPELPATTLAPNCYESMFSGCTSLTLAPDLPATSLALGRYGGMFFGCSSLQNPPALSATTLAESSCMNMFTECSALKESPVLSAQTLSQYCYSMMFSRCTSLKKITCTASNLSAENALLDWVDGVPSGAGGTFVKKSGVSWPTGTSGIPTGWTVQ